MWRASLYVLVFLVPRRIRVSAVAVLAANLTVPPLDDELALVLARECLPLLDSRPLGTVGRYGLPPARLLDSPLPRPCGLTITFFFDMGPLPFLITDQFLRFGAAEANDR